MGDMAAKSDLFAVKSNAAIPPKRTLASVLLEAILRRSASTTFSVKIMLGCWFIGISDEYEYTAR